MYFLMSLRREFMSYVGAGAIGGIFGYYVGAQELLGIQSENEPVGQQSSEQQQESVSSTINYDWESGEKEGWEIVDIYYGGSNMVHEFNIVEDSIEGQFSPQIETLNDRVRVQSPDLRNQSTDGNFSQASIKVRLEGDLSVYSNNFNEIRINDINNETVARVRFRHGNNNIQWSTDEDNEILRSFEKGETYDITIESTNDNFTVIINGQEYTGLDPYDDTHSDVAYVVMRSRTEGGPSSSSYNDSIYWTWDDLSIEMV